MSSSLKGLRVLNTRPKTQAAALSNEIRNAGGLAIDLPTLEIIAVGNWLDCLPDLKKVDQAIFISANAVEHCFIQLSRHHLSWPETIHVIAIGHSTAAALAKFNIITHSLPETSDSEHVLDLATLQNIEGQTILLFKGLGGRPLIAETLLKRSATLISVNVYQRIMPKINAQFIKSIWQDDLVDIILVTSEQSMQHLFQLFPKEAYSWLCNKTCLVLSERLAQSASSLGIKKIIRCHPSGMINALIDYVSKD